MNRKVSSIILLALVSLLLMPATLLAVYGKTYTWISQDGYWWDKANWLPDDGPPILFDQAIIDRPTPLTVTSDKGASVSQLALGAGHTLLISAGSLAFNNNGGAIATFLTNNGVIQVQNQAGGGGANISTWGADVSFQGDGTIVLGGDEEKDSLTNNGWGGVVTNTATHTIRGGGLIHLTLVNQGPIIADNGNLNLSQCDITNTGSTMSASGAGNTLGFIACQVSGGQINPQDGKIYMWGTTFSDVVFGSGLMEVDAPSPGHLSVVWNEGIVLSPGTTVNILKNLYIGPVNGHTTVVNDGTLHMNGTGCRLYGSNHLTLQGAGSLVMGGDGDNYLETYDITLDPSQTLQGGGTISTKIYNNGAVIANNGILNLYYGRIMGSGTVSIADDATLNLTGGSEVLVQAGDLTMSILASLTVGASIPIELQRNFSFAQTDPAKWDWGTDTMLKMSGQGPVQTLEVGGRDYGASDTGLTNNFALPKLQVAGIGTQVELVDLIDNGHRTGGASEVLYVDTLEVLPGATLNLNKIKLYAYLDGDMHLVRPGEGSLFGGGLIIGPGGGTISAISLLLLD